ncbi:MAG: HEAT repeat domain-containing protein [Methylococcales bacterium]|nr:HEAT repeat domain-containing protein [Methylococcales bacterium]
MIVIKFWMTCLFLLISGKLLAAIDVSDPGEQNVQIVITEDNGTELQLEARQAPLSKVLDSIASKTGVRINYSVLPDGLVTATCVGPTVKQVMECLLVRKADLVFRYSQQPSKVGPQGQPVEAWVLGAKFGAGQSNSIVCLPAVTQQQIVPSAVNPKTGAAPDETDELVKMAASKVPAERAEAIGRLMAGGREGDATVRETLEAALSDQDARVRVQAVSSLAHREGAGASAALHDALHDSDISVRLTAVNYAGNDVALLQQALTDSDATVRQLAGIRLEPFLKTDSAQ